MKALPPRPIVEPSRWLLAWQPVGGALTLAGVLHIRLRRLSARRPDGVAKFLARRGLPISQ